MMDLEGIKLLRCPSCRAALEYSGSTDAGRVKEGRLRCTGCQSRWLVEEGLCRLYTEEEVRGSDRFMRLLYNGLARLHDPAVRYTLPLFQAGTEQELRLGYLLRMELHRIVPRSDGRPIRILDVGCGTCADIPVLRKLLPPGLAVEIWGLDLSRRMLDLGRQRIEREGLRDLRLLMADAHALPFPDGMFDRVFHIGGIAGYGRPALALSEMARVAVPGSPIVVVDEQLDRGRTQSLYNRLTFRMVTFYDPDPHCPVEHVPPHATEVRAEQLNRFFYCLTFRC